MPKFFFNTNKLIKKVVVMMGGGGGGENLPHILHPGDHKEMLSILAIRGEGGGGTGSQPMSTAVLMVLK
jgi:hypothetical protein